MALHATWIPQQVYHVLPLPCCPARYEQTTSKPIGSWASASQVKQFDLKNSRVSKHGICSEQEAIQRHECIRGNQVNDQESASESVPHYNFVWMQWGLNEVGTGSTIIDYMHQTLLHCMHSHKNCKQSL